MHDEGDYEETNRISLSGDAKGQCSGILALL